MVAVSMKDLIYEPKRLELKKEVHEEEDKDELFMLLDLVVYVLKFIIFPFVILIKLITFPVLFLVELFKTIKRVCVEVGEIQRRNKAGRFQKEVQNNLDQA